MAIKIRFWILWFVIGCVFGAIGGALTGSLGVAWLVLALWMVAPLAYGYAP